MSIETEVAILKKDVDDLKTIHHRLDSAIEKIADVSQSLHTIMAVHDEKLARQEETLDYQEKKLQDNIQELHSRITTNSKETLQYIAETERRLCDAMNEHNRKSNLEFDKLHNEISRRVGILEKWRWIIIGGSIVLGFIIQKLPVWSI